MQKLCFVEHQVSRIKLHYPSRKWHAKQIPILIKEQYFTIMIEPIRNRSRFNNIIARPSALQVSVIKIITMYTFCACYLFVIFGQNDSSDGVNDTVAPAFSEISSGPLTVLASRKWCLS